MHRKDFLRSVGLITAGMYIPFKSWAKSDFPTVRIPLAERKFTSQSIENAINTIQKNIKNKELAWLFNNCFPNTLDTTVDFTIVNGRPDTYVITGDIDAMWLRDSSAQVWPYLAFIKEDKHLQQLIAGVINRQAANILMDPYANAFYKDHTKVSEWKDDQTDMKPGIHERKWEIDSLCYPVRLVYGYWKVTGDNSVFNTDWKEAAKLIIKTFRQQQRKENKGPYHFERTTSWATDGVPLGGYGYPVNPVGLICSMFRPSDDATIYPFLIPSNYFAITSLNQIAEISNRVYHDASLANETTNLAQEVKKALNTFSIATHTTLGQVLAYEVNGFGSINLMDDANVPSLLSLPYLNAIAATDPLYQRTRQLILSPMNPFFFKGKAAEGVGGPHAGLDMIWPLSIIMRGLTAIDNTEIHNCIKALITTHAGTGFMHESFHKDDPSKFTRKWFAWANTLYGELVWKTFTTNKPLLTSI